MKLPVPKLGYLANLFSACTFHIHLLFSMVSPLTSLSQELCDYLGVHLNGLSISRQPIHIHKDPFLCTGTFPCYGDEGLILAYYNHVQILPSCYYRCYSPLCSATIQQDLLFQFPGASESSWWHLDIVFLPTVATDISPASHHLT